MRDGLLWFRDNPNRTLDEDIKWAAIRFQQKFHLAPDTIQVSETEIELYEKITGYEIIPVKNFQKGFFYLLHTGIKIVLLDGEK